MIHRCPDEDMCFLCIRNDHIVNLVSAGLSQREVAVIAHLSTAQIGRIYRAHIQREADALIEKQTLGT